MVTGFPGARLTDLAGVTCGLSPRGISRADVPLESLRVRTSVPSGPGAKASLTAVSVQREILFSSRYPVWNFPMVPRPTMPRRTFFIEGEVRSVVAGKKRRQLFSAKFSTGRTRRSVLGRSPLSPTTLHFCNVPDRPRRKPCAILHPRSAQSFHPSKPIQP